MESARRIWEEIGLPQLRRPLGEDAQTFSLLLLRPFEHEFHSLNIFP
jgi:hypothetical protein